jgi:hypothetical protein
MSCVEAVLLSELTRRHVDPPPVQNGLHGLENILSVRRSCNISLLLAIHHYFDDLAKFNGRRSF